MFGSIKSCLQHLATHLLPGTDIALARPPAAPAHRLLPRVGTVKLPLAGTLTHILLSSII